MLYIGTHNIVSGIKYTKINRIEEFRTNGKLEQKTVNYTALFVIIVSEASSSGGAQQKRQLACLP